MASQCSDRADDSDISGREAALAYYHATVAYNTQGDHAAAANMAQRSFSELSNNDSWLTSPPSSLSDRARDAWLSQRRQFQLDRLVQSAKAYKGLAESFGTAGATSSSAACTSRNDCLSRAIDRLREGESIAAGLAGGGTVARAPAYDDYYLMLAELYQARANAADIEPAIRAYQSVASSPLTSGQAASARAKLATMTTSLGQEAAKKPTASDAAQAIRYFNIAREAEPKNVDAILGLAQVQLRLGGSSNDVAQLRNAESTFTEALALAGTDARKAAAYSGRGAARDALASLTGSSREGAIEDYAAASQLANSADTFLLLASACGDRGDWSCADENYTKGIDRLKAEGAPAARLSETLIAHANVRAEMPAYNAGSVRALLQQAVNTNPASPDAVMALARHDMKAGNWADAEAGFKRLVATSVAGADTYKAEAYSELSKLTAARPGGDLAQAIDYADEAVKLDSADPVYRRQLCLARIYRGASSVTSSKFAGTCALGSSAESGLLQAMFEMRKAQYSSTNGAASIRRDARDHINSALDRVTSGARIDFDWPAKTSQPPVKTQAVLLYLREATLACGGNYTFNPPQTDGITSADYAAARTFLDFYKSRLCT